MNRADVDMLAIWAEDELFCQHAGWSTRFSAAVRDVLGATGGNASR